LGSPPEAISVQTGSIVDDSRREVLKHKWIESQKAGRDLGETAVDDWARNHWPRYWRTRWVEHMQGRRYWVELDQGDFGLLRQQFHDKRLLLDRILDHVIAGMENLDIICWAQDWGLNVDDVLAVLESLDINSRRVAFQQRKLA